MKEVRLKNVKIAAISCALPTTKTEAYDYADHFGEKVIKKFIRTTGVKERWLTNGKQLSSDLCQAAVKKIFEAGFAKNDEIDGCIFISQTPDYWTPSTAFVLQKRLELPKNCVCFDMNLGCTSFLHGVSVAASMISSGAAKKVLVLAGDARQWHGVSDDTAETMMFGEAGSAVLLEYSEGSEIPMDLFSDGYHFDFIMNPFGDRFRMEDGRFDLSKFVDHMDGGEVFNFTVTEVPKAIREFCEWTSTSLEKYQSLILHQANVFILKHIANELDLPVERVAISMDRYGNTNGASIPVTICDLVEREGDNLPDKLDLLASGFGIGLSWGVTRVEIEKNRVLPFVHTDEYFEGAWDFEFLYK